MENQNQSNERSALSHNYQNLRPPSYGSIYSNSQTEVDQNEETLAVQEIIQQDDGEIRVQSQTVIVLSNLSTGIRCPECGAEGTLIIIPKVSIWQHYWALLFLLIL